MEQNRDRNSGIQYPEIPIFITRFEHWTKGFQSHRVHGSNLELFSLEFSKEKWVLEDAASPPMAYWNQ